MSFEIETLRDRDWKEVGDLIFASTNAWYQQHRGFSIFQCDPEEVQVFCQVYEALDPGSCLIARCQSSHRIIGSCFFHPRSTHVSLGIMNVHPEEFGKGIARTLLGRITAIADEKQLPLRLVSSAMNLDSFSLYTRAGFVPRQLYQDLQLSIPPTGMAGLEPGFCPNPNIRPATLADLESMGELESQVSGIRREADYAHFINNKLGIWNCSVLEGTAGLMGWIASIQHPASSMIGPCIAADEWTALALLKSQIDDRRGSETVFLVPANCREIVRSAYGWGAKNCELHVLQVRGDHAPFRGVSMPTFLPETA